MTMTSCLRAKRLGDVVLVTVRGAYTDGLHTEIVKLVADEIDEAPVRSIVIDITEADFPSRGAPPMRGGGPARLPVALVVRAQMMDAVSSVCAAVCAHGLLWMPFIRQADAVQWAAARPPYWERFARR